MLTYIQIYAHTVEEDDDNGNKDKDNDTVGDEEEEEDQTAKRMLTDNSHDFCL